MGCEMTEETEGPNGRARGSAQRIIMWFLSYFFLVPGTW